MSSHSPLFGRRVHIAGSIDLDSAIASAEEVKAAREFVVALVIGLMKKGAVFVVPVDAEKTRPDGSPICFDWLIWQTIAQNLAKRPTGAPNPVAIAIQHHKTEDQIPTEMHSLWDDLRGSDLIIIDNASHWNMASKRMEAAATHGDILVTLGGGEGVLYLANLYHEAGKPVVPLNFRLCRQDQGSLKLFSQALTATQSDRFFATEGTAKAHALINRINFVGRHQLDYRVAEVLALLEKIRRPMVFAVRLLNKSLPEYVEVDNYFSAVVKHVVEIDLGYTLKVVDGRQANESPTIDAEIFTKLHHSSVVVADLTGSRPNCLIELGYALARSVPVMMTAKEGTKFPFDVETLPGLHWNPISTIDDQRRLFREYWDANIRRPAIVAEEPLVP
jgi:hypothetical protein